MGHTKWSDIKRRLAPDSDSAANVARRAREMEVAEDAYKRGREDALATGMVYQPDPLNEVRRRLAIEALIDAHYDCGLDAARVIDWLMRHHDEARAVVAALLRAP